MISCTAAAIIAAALFTAGASLVADSLD